MNDWSSKSKKGYTTSRGGRREGAGRAPVFDSPATKQVSFRVTEKQHETLASFAQSGETPNQAARRIIIAFTANQREKKMEKHIQFGQIGLGPGLDIEVRLSSEEGIQDLPIRGMLEDFRVYPVHCGISYQFSDGNSKTYTHASHEVRIFGADGKIEGWLVEPDLVLVWRATKLEV